MPNKFIIPYAVPVQWIPINPVRIPQYISKFMDSYRLVDRLTKWQQGVCPYKQPWLQDDSIRLQFITNQGQAQIDVIDCDMTSYVTVLTTQKQQNTFDPDTFIYEAAIALAGLANGVYFLRMVLLNGQTWITEALNVQDEHDPSLLIEYSNSKYYGNIIFETGYTASIRVSALLRLKPPVSKDTLYEDQVLDMTMVQSKPYRVWELIIGAEGGVPDWVIDKLNWVLGCDSLQIDGRLYTKNEGFTWTESENIFNGAMIGYRGELREQLNRGAKIYVPGSGDAPQGSGFGSGSTGSSDVTGGRNTIILTVGAKGFADTGEDASSNLVTFLDVD